MDDLINNINDINYLKDNVQVFSLMPKGSKLDFLEKLKSIRTEIIGQFLNEVLSSESDKQVQKEIKKLLFRLRTMGIKLEEPKIEGGSVLKRIEEKREHHGLMSNYDGEGTRMAMVAFEAKRNSYVLVHSLIHFSKGLLELANAPVDSGGLKKIIGQYVKDTGKPFFVAEVSPRYASYLMEESSSLSGKFAEEMKQMKIFSSRLGGTVQKPGDIYSLETPEATEPLSLERILRLELFESFSLDWDTAEDDRKLFNEIGGSSSIVLPPYMVEEKKQAFLKELLEGNKLKPTMPLIKRLMEDYAYIFHCKGNFSAYKGLVDALKDNDGLLRAGSFLARKTLEIMEEKQPGLIVNPYEQVHTQR